MKSKNLAVILVCPENVDNIGAVARAMKNMGFSDFRLVKPPPRWRIKGKKMAMSAVDVLSDGKVFSSLSKATTDLKWAIGTTRRSGGKRGFFLRFSDAICKIQKKSGHQKIGIVFGCESKGLSNPDLDLCDQAVTIPASSAYPSLNLAQAVMVILFSLSTNQKADAQEEQDGTNFLNKEEVEMALRHFRKALEALDYQEGGANLLPRILKTMKGLIKRGGLLSAEGQMIKGLSRRICEKVLSCRGSKVK